MSQYTSQEVTYGQAFGLTVVSALKTVPGQALINSAKLRLFKNPSLAPDPVTPLADLVAAECDFSGYPAGGIAVVLTVGLVLSNSCVGALTTGLFVADDTDPFVSGSAYGWWIDDGTNVIAVEKFAGGSAVPFAGKGAFLDLSVELPLQLLQATL